MCPAGEKCVSASGCVPLCGATPCDLRLTCNPRTGLCEDTSCNNVTCFPPQVCKKGACVDQGAGGIGGMGGETTTSSSSTGGAGGAAGDKGSCGAASPEIPRKIPARRSRRWCSPWASRRRSGADAQTPPPGDRESWVDGAAQFRED